jgi:hypothetical protein
LKYGDALSSRLINFTLEYSIVRVQETNLEIHMKTVHQILTYANDINLIGDIKAIVINACVLLNTCKDTDITVGMEK